jgi:hypothetical protein
MTSKKEIVRLESEITALDRMIANSSDSNPLRKFNLQHRKEQVLSKLTAAQGGEPESSATRLTFKGPPVSLEEGIQADFAGAALKTFGDMTEVHGDPLYIVGIARGSFGFQLASTSNAAAAGKQVRRAISVLGASVGSDQDLNEALSDLDRAAVAKIKSFVRVLSAHKTVCTVEHGDAKFSFHDMDQVKRSAKMLRSVDIEPEHHDIIGQFMGYLPLKREFEFLPQGETDTIRGKVDKKIRDAHQINNILNQEASIMVSIKQFPNRKPAYTVVDYQTI